MRSQSSDVASRRFVKTISRSSCCSADAVGRDGADAVWRDRTDAEHIGQASAAFAPPVGEDLHIGPDGEVTDPEVEVALRLDRVVDLGPRLHAGCKCASQDVALDLADVRV